VLFGKGIDRLARQSETRNENEQIDQLMPNHITAAGGIGKGPVNKMGYRIG
jgi:hypothetical protein